jgi:hypothetical protein
MKRLRFSLRVKLALLLLACSHCPAPACST